MLPRVWYNKAVVDGVIIADFVDPNYYKSMKTESMIVTDRSVLEVCLKIT